MNKKRATEDRADELHGLVFELLIAELKHYTKDPGVDEEGKPLPRPVPPPALIAQAIKLLKDNGIDSPVRAKALQDALADALPDLEEVDTEHLGSVQ